jgi:hypothetical protein
VIQPVRAGHKEWMDPLLCVSDLIYMCVGRTIDRRAGAAIKAARCRQCEAMACEGWRSSSPISEIVSNANTPPIRDRMVKQKTPPTD